ncbi:ribonuclease H-like domain-containing protein [Patescibacteria group bacterium]|nr:ribonuclease H-like domain-containing protein [Patescibacteria group bacterium]MBU1705135.1 ribonuclease H-like domain-containing protein [Patescibacteria group bacterium]
MSGKEVVLDIETSNTFQDVGEYAPQKLDVSVIGVYFYETDEYRAYELDELPELWPRLERADRIIGYNTKNFDYPVMNRYYSGDFLTFPSLDILEEIHKALGFRLKLDDVAAASVGHRKSGHGLQAVEWWRQGEKDKVKNYCLDDVRVTKEVYEYGLKYNALAYEDHFGNRKGIPVDFVLRAGESKPINLTMPL